MSTDHNLNVNLNANLLYRHRYHFRFTVATTGVFWTYANGQVVCTLVAPLQFLSVITDNDSWIGGLHFTISLSSNDTPRQYRIASNVITM